MNPNTTWSDAHLVLAYQSGITKAWNIICIRHKGNLRGFFYNKGVRNPEDLNDLIQETLLEAMRNVDKNQIPESFSRWLYRIATGTLSRWLQREDKRREVQESIAISNQNSDTNEVYAPTSQGPAQSTIDTEYLEIVFSLIEQLPSSEAEVLQMHSAGMTNSEIAENLGITVNATKVRLSKGKKKLKDWLKDEYPEVYADLVDNYLCFVQ